MGSSTSTHGYDSSVRDNLALYRGLLEEQWRNQVAEITRLSVEALDDRDAARDDASREEALRIAALLIATERQGLHETEAALARLDANRYGSCEQCGTAVPAERLEVVPHTRYCVACQQRRPSRS